MTDGRSQEELASALISQLAEQKQTVAMAESLTGGLLTAALVEVPGASAVLAGAVVAYTVEVKRRVLGVEAGLLADCGPVDPQVAAQMARGVRDLLGADWGLSTTGVAGPGPQDGVPAGRAFVGIAGPATAGPYEGISLELDGARGQVRAECVRRALALLSFALSAVASRPVPEQVAAADR